MVHFDPFDYRTHEDPYPIYQQLRDEAPAYFNEEYGFWILSRYEDCNRAALDFRLFSSATGTTLEELRGQMPTMINMDPPEHTKLRRLLAARFLPPGVNPLEQAVRRLARELLAPHAETGRLDIIADFAARLPMAIICQMLGFPREDEDMLRGWTDAVVHRDEGEFAMPDGGVEASAKLHDYYDRFTRERARGPGRDDLVDILIAAEQASEISHDEVLGYLFLLSIAGNETTTKLIGNMTYQLHRHPEQRDWMRQDPKLFAAAVEETMRFDGPTQMMARTIARDVEMHGRQMAAGQKIGLLFISANRDERKYENADLFDIRRNPRDHLGFGVGPHACLGAALARLEGRVALEEILRLMPDYAVREDGLARMHSPNVRGYTNVPVEFTPATLAA